MKKNKRARTHVELGQELSKVPGFTEGREHQKNILMLGDKLRTLRKDILGVTQVEAARIIGLEQPELSRIENGTGKRGPSFITISRVIDAYQNYLRQQDPGYALGLSFDVTVPEEAERRYLIAGSGDK